jgi:hypothetical protein
MDIDQVIDRISEGLKLPQISFAWTTEAFLAGHKTVTRRQGAKWILLKKGDLLMAIEKGQGLKRGEKVRRLDVIEVVSAIRVGVSSINYEDLFREGGSWKSTEEFVEMYCRGNRCEPGHLCTRIEFRRLGVPDDVLKSGQMVASRSARP